MIVNRQLMAAFLEEEGPCAMLGIAEDDQGQCGLIALKLDTVLPRDVAAAGFALGNALFGNRDWQVLHLAFNFYGFRNYNLLANPATPAMRRVLDTIVATENYMFLAFDSDRSATGFKSGIGPDSQSDLIDKLRSVRASTTVPAQYDRALRQFAMRPDPPGVQLEWVCRQEAGLLEPSHDPLTLTPR